MTGRGRGWGAARGGGAASTPRVGRRWSSRHQIMAASAIAGSELVVRRKLVGALQVGRRAIDLRAGVDRRIEQRLLDDPVAGLERHHAGEVEVAVVISRLEVPPLRGAVAVYRGLHGVSRQRLVVLAPNDRLDGQLVVACVVVAAQPLFGRWRGEAQA